MAKSTKHQDNVPSLDDFRAPWETAQGGETEIDKPKLKSFIRNLMVDKAKAQDAREDALADVAAAETERDEAKEAAAKASPEEAQKQIQKLERDNADLKAERDKLVAEKADRDLRAEVLEGVDPKVAKYVTGSTKEELEESLKAVKADFGITDGDGEEEEEEEINPFSRPRTDLTNPLRPKQGDDDAPVDFDKVAGQILGNRVF